MPKCVLIGFPIALVTKSFPHSQNDTSTVKNAIEETKGGDHNPCQLDFEEILLTACFFSLYFYVNINVLPLKRRILFMLHYILSFAY